MCSLVTRTTKQGIRAPSNWRGGARDEFYLTEDGIKFIEAMKKKFSVMNGKPASPFTSSFSPTQIDKCDELFGSRSSHVHAASSSPIQAVGTDHYQTACHISPEPMRRPPEIKKTFSKEDCDLEAALYQSALEAANSSASKSVPVSPLSLRRPKNFDCDVPTPHDLYNEEHKTMHSVTVNPPDDSAGESPKKRRRTSEDFDRTDPDCCPPQQIRRRSSGDQIQRDCTINTSPSPSPQKSAREMAAAAALKRQQEFLEAEKLKQASCQSPKPSQQQTPTKPAPTSTVTYRESPKPSQQTSTKLSETIEICDSQTDSHEISITDSQPEDSPVDSSLECLESLSSAPASRTIINGSNSPPHSLECMACLNSIPPSAQVTCQQASKGLSHESIVQSTGVIAHLPRERHDSEPAFLNANSSIQPQQEKRGVFRLLVDTRERVSNSEPRSLLHAIQRNMKEAVDHAIEFCHSKASLLSSCETCRQQLPIGDYLWTWSPSNDVSEDRSVGLLVERKRVGDLVCRSGDKADHLEV